MFAQKKQTMEMCLNNDFKLPSIYLYITYSRDTPMQFFTTDDFHKRFLHKYFAVAFRDLYNNTSSSSWVDITRPINIYKRTTDFLQYLHSLQTTDHSFTVADILHDQFLVPVDRLLLEEGIALADDEVAFFLIGNLPKLHRLLVQLLFRAFWLCVLTPKPMDTEILGLLRLISFVRIAIVNETDPHAELILDFVIKFVLEKSTNKESFAAFKIVLRKAGLESRFKTYIQAAQDRIRPKTSNFIQNFEQVPLKNSDRKQLQLALKKEIILQTTKLIVPVSQSPKKTPKNTKSPAKIFKTPEKVASKSRRKDESSQKKLVRCVPTKSVCQRTIFEVKNKKFIPKRIQFPAESTAASSCSNLPVLYEDSMRSYLFKSHNDDDLQGIIAFATPVKKVKEAYQIFTGPAEPAASTVLKKQPDRFFNGAFTKSAKGSR